VELHDALTQIGEIHRRVAATGEFRGYRSLPVAASGVIAIVAAWLQPVFVPPGDEPIRDFTLYWTAVAVIAGAPAAVRIYLFDWRDAHSAGRELTRLAVSQFLPCLAAGALVTIAIIRQSPEFGWALTGLWQILFSLGVFASCRLLPRATHWVGMVYLCAGTWNLAYGRADINAYSPWSMGLPFAVGQLLTAAILYLQQERNRADENP
jgi:hypothetical protein